METIGTHHDPGGLGYRRARLGSSADARDLAVFDEDLIDAKPFANLGAGGRGCVDEHRVEHGAPRAVRHG